MKLFYSYMWRLFVHISTLSKEIRIPLKIFSPANQWHRLVMPRRLLLHFTIFVSMFSNVHAQSAGERADARAEVIKEVLIGRKVPEDFWVKEHLFFVNGDTTRRSLQEFQGKMLVLDFWSSGCVPCLLPQKQIKEYVERYKGKLAVVLVNSTKTKDSFEKLKTLYEKGFFKKFGLESFESIILDDHLSSLFPYSAFPQYVWINEYGMLQLRTYRNLMDADYVAPFIDVKP